MADAPRLTMDERFRLFEEENQRLQLQEEKSRQIPEENQRLQIPSPKIQSVAHYLRGRQDFTNHYLPKLVSFGPIHHGAANLRLGEQYKLMWSAMYVNSTGQNARDLHKRIADNIKGLKDLFDKDLFDVDEFTTFESQGFKDLDEKISWMLFVDGCSLLQILDQGNLGEPLDYNKLNVKIDQLFLVQQDVLLLENQLPYQVLRLLSCRVNADAKLLESMDKFLRTHHLWPEPRRSSMDGKKEDKDPKRIKEYSSSGQDSTVCSHLEASGGRPTPKKDNLQEESKVVLQPPPVHLLDHLRSTILGDCCPENDPQMSESGVIMEITHRNIQELKASGIKLKKIDSRRPKHIKFSAGKLMLPDIIVDDTTAPTFLNLIAYEMCPDFQNDYGISSFVAFLDSLIDHPDDVKHLRSAGILLNALGSDEEVSRLFNAINTDLVTNVRSYSDVRKGIEMHYRNIWKTWMYQALSTHFSSPWAIIALLAAIIALVLTFIQTLYSIKGS